MACLKFCLSTYQSALWAKRRISLCEPYAPYLYKEERKCLTGVNMQANKMIWNAWRYTSHTANDEQKFAFGIHANFRLSKGRGMLSHSSCQSLLPSASVPSKHLYALVHSKAAPFLQSDDLMCPFNVHSSSWPKHRRECCDRHVIVTRKYFIALEHHPLYLFLLYLQQGRTLPRP